jgi:site-specific DNA recombinase
VFDRFKRKTPPMPVDECGLPIWPPPPKMKGVTMDSPKAIGYTRVSTGRQVNEGVSMDMQEAKIRAYCIYKGYTLTHIYSDEGISGSGKVERPGLDNVREWCSLRNTKDSQLGPVAVIIYSLSRFTRSTKELLDFVDEFVINGKIELHSVVEALDTSSPTGRFMLKVMGAMNELEREQIVERTKAALDHKRTKGEKLGGYVPYGYDVLPNTGLLKVNQYEQGIITRIKEYHNRGVSSNSIAKTLNDEGVTTKQGNEWSHKSVHRVLIRV